MERTAAILAARFSEKEILCDKFHTPEFSRSDLAFYLPELYEKEADLIVAVICPDYEKREWCGLEWDALFGLLKKRKVSEVMLTRFARVEARGLHGLAGYTDLDDLTPAQAAEGILERLAFNEGRVVETLAPALPLFLAGQNARLQIACGGLNRFLEFTGRWDESLSFNQQAEARAVAAGDHLEAGWVQGLRGRADSVLVCAARAEAHWLAAKTSAVERSAAVCLRGNGHSRKSDHPAAIAAFREALELRLSREADSRDASTFLAALANSKKDSGDAAGAERDYREALRMAKAVGYEEGVARYTGNLARLALDRRDWPRVETLAREALTLSEKVGRQELIGIHCTQLATALLRQGRAAGAEREARRAVDIFTKLNAPDLAAAQRTLAECAQAARAPSRKSRTPAVLLWLAILALILLAVWLSR